MNMTHARLGLAILAAHGLEKRGAWMRGNYASVRLPNGHCWPFGLAFDLPAEWGARRDVVYAFVTDAAQVLYIGETSRGLAQRLGEYRYGNPVESDTDNRVKHAITQALAAGAAVGIWAVQPVASLSLPDGSSLRVPASKPLEEHLIAHIKPGWNVKMRVA